MNYCYLTVIIVLFFWTTAGPSAPPEVMARWHTDEDAISPKDLKAHEAPTFTAGGIPVDPPPRRFCV